MLTICDTHILLFWADAPKRLSVKADDAVNSGSQSGTLACADISLWEIAMLYERGRINNHAGVSSGAYIQDILLALNVTVLPITAEIAELSQSNVFSHGDPADRIIAATSIVHHAALITADAKLLAVPTLRCIW